MNQEKDASILTHFASLEDPRDNRGKEHLLIDIIAIALCAVMSGAEGWEDMAEYGKAKQEWLATFLNLSNGIPSADTFARVFARIDPEAFQECFRDWVRCIRELISGEVVSIDGKTLKHSYDKNHGKTAIQIVSAWASEQRLVLGQRQVDKKSNEITAIPELLEILEISGCIVTIDAMGCQKEIARKIVEKQADYILGLKGNQAGLYEDVQWLFEQAQANNFQEVAHDFVQTVDKGHGRLEIRRCWTISELEYLIQKPLWSGLQTIVMVERECRFNDQVTKEARFFISSLAGDAAKIAQAVRSHWSIENSLHWVLDVSFHEDNCRIRHDHAAENMALLRHFALNILSQDKSTKRGIAAKRKKAAWHQPYLINLLTQ